MKKFLYTFIFDSYKSDKSSAGSNGKYRVLQIDPPLGIPSEATRWQVDVLRQCAIGIGNHGLVVLAPLEGHIFGDIRQDVSYVVSK